MNIIIWMEMKIHECDLMLHDFDENIHSQGRCYTMIVLNKLLNGKFANVGSLHF